jgi:hypothetical protein
MGGNIFLSSSNGGNASIQIQIPSSQLIIGPFSHQKQSEGRGKGPSTEWELVKGIIREEFMGRGAIEEANGPNEYGGVNIYGQSSSLLPSFPLSQKAMAK